MLTKKTVAKPKKKSGDTNKKSSNCTSAVFSNMINLSKNKNNQNTKVIFNCDIGFKNELFIRGCGAGLSWEKGQKLKNISADKWEWNCCESFDSCECKVLINDCEYECGQNHKICCGDCQNIKPKF